MHMTHGRENLPCLLVTHNKRKVQIQPAFHPSDNVKKGRKYQTHYAQGWDPKLPTETSLALPFQWKHTRGLRTYLLRMSLPTVHYQRILAEIPLTQPYQAQSTGVWTTCFPRLSAPESLIMNHQEGSLFQNSPHPMDQLILSTISCIIDSL